MKSKDERCGEKKKQGKLKLEKELIRYAQPTDSKTPSQPSILGYPQASARPNIQT